VTPELFVGDQYRKRGIEKLARLGINGTINMRTEFDDAARGLVLEHHLHLPTIDDTAPTFEHLLQGVRFIDRVITSGGKVYIHCAGGMGRAPTMGAAYLMYKGRTLHEALALIRSVRPFINPRTVQIEQLKRFTARLSTEVPTRKQDDDVV
jgi:protein-tyrosine phosphatase